MKVISGYNDVYMVNRSKLNSANHVHLMPIMEIPKRNELIVSLFQLRFRILIQYILQIGVSDVLIRYNPSSTPTRSIHIILLFFVLRPVVFIYIFISISYIYVLMF